MWIDIHAHLYDLNNADLARCLHEAAQRRVHAVINTATTLANSEKVIEQCAAHDMLHAAAGVSPFDTENLSAGWIDRLEALVSDTRVVGIGETGIDTTNPLYPALEKQMPAFENQLSLARKKDLPAIIHSRGAERRACEICCSTGTRKALFHCFTGDIDALRLILDASYYVSFSGIITFPKSNLAECVAYVPLDRLFIETDAPYLAPVPFRGKPNRPAWVVETGMAVAAIKKMPPESIARQIAINTQALFGIQVPDMSP